jgi:hypothetical protein
VARRVATDAERTFAPRQSASLPTPRGQHWPGAALPRRRRSDTLRRRCRPAPHEATGRGRVVWCAAAAIFPSRLLHPPAPPPGHRPPRRLGRPSRARVPSRGSMRRGGAPWQPAQHEQPRRACRGAASSGWRRSASSPPCASPRIAAAARRGVASGSVRMRRRGTTGGHGVYRLLRSSARLAAMSGDASEATQAIEFGMAA